MSKRVGGGSYQSVDLLDEEEVVDGQQARYGDSLFRARGKLFLTNRRLIFCPVKNWIGLSVPPIALELERITAIGRQRGGWITKLFILGQNADSWFVEVDGRRHWFDLGSGWNEMWMERFADRLGLTAAEVKER